MTLDLSNPDRLTFKDMSDEVAAAIFIAWRNGDVMEWWTDLSEKWLDFEYDPEWYRYGIYRVRPVPLRPMLIPWAVIDPKWTQAARDRDRAVYLYAGGAAINESMGFWTGDNSLYITGLLRGMDPGTVNWRDSKQTRPEGV